MPGGPLQKLARDATLSPSTVSNISKGRVGYHRPRRRRASRPSDLSRVRLHPLILTELKRRTHHLDSYKLLVLSPLEIVIH